MSFEFEFTEEKLQQCLSRNKNISVLFEALENVLPKYEITTVERVAAFLAQCGHESLAGDIGKCDTLVGQEQWL